MGTGDLAFYLGASARFSPKEGVWYEPCLKDAETIPELKLDPKNKWWRLTLQMIDAALARAEGCYLVSIPTIGENLDILASLRGTNNLLLDLIERPWFVHGCQKQIVKTYKDCYDQLYQKVKDSDGGVMAHYVWGPGRTTALQNDFSCMISPEMFTEFAIPYYERQLEAVDHAWYHLDGEGALKHIDALLEIPKIKAIQWVAGTKNEEYGYHDGSPRWYPYTKKVLAAGKNLMLGVPLSEVESVVHEFGPRGLFIGVHGIPDREAGESLLKAALKWK